ncbi:ATP-binding cassette domain-containing protein [Kocuria sp. M4R2S49]|uniref:ATP-binding cassette domain-containing protein n=1 Tax=Kocuria rhizosphaericola TaxID=3376284 RepID=UPI0037ACAF23
MTTQPHTTPAPGAHPADPASTEGPAALVALEAIGKRYGNIIALRDVTMTVEAGKVTCVLGDNGAGKSTLIKIIAGLHQHTDGTLRVNGEETTFTSPRQALDAGIATVYQDLAVVPLMPVWRNFFLGSELTTGFGPFKRLDVAKMKEITKQELADMGIDLRDVDQPIGTLSGGERQCVAIARAVHFGAKVLILDEPTAALGVKQSGVVLRYILQAKERGLGVVFITHNPHHAYPVGDRFLLLKRGKSIGYYEKQDITVGDLTAQMAGGAELEELTHELAQLGGHTSQMQQVQADMAESLAAPSDRPRHGQ